jgi:peptidoglycan hydrolase-like protein with peptidoglycan-binding domain
VSTVRGRLGVLGVARRPITIMVAVCVVSLGIGLGVGHFVTSPEDELAATRPPPPTRLTEPVTRRGIQETVQGAGTVGFSRTRDITIPEPANGDAAVVTAVNAEAGDQVTSGEVVCTVAGRPVFVVSGDFPLYRDILPGDSGPDVRQVQEALRQLGWLSPLDGVFGTQTQAAVAALYKDRGFSPPTLEPSADEEDESPEPDAGAHPKSSSATQAPRESPGGGVYVPAAEIVFTPAMPAMVLSTTISVGATLAGPAYQLASGRAFVVIKVPPSQGDQVKHGMKARLTDPAGGETVGGTVVSVGEATSDEASGLTVPVTVRYRRAPPVSAAGSQVQVTIQTRSSTARLLTVPQSAVFTSADGALSVLRVRSGKTDRVPVTLGASGSGFVEVTPTASTLVVGDRVVVSSAP